MRNSPARPPAPDSTSSFPGGSTSYSLEITAKNLRAPPRFRGLVIQLRHDLAAKWIHLRPNRSLINTIAERQPRRRSRWWHRSRLLQNTRLTVAGAPCKRANVNTAKSLDIQTKVPTATSLFQ